MASEVEQWIEIAKECKYLPENDLKVNISIIPFNAKARFRPNFSACDLDTA